MYASASACAIACASEYAGRPLNPVHECPISSRRKRSVEAAFLPELNQIDLLAGRHRLTLEAERAAQDLRVERTGQAAVGR